MELTKQDKQKLGELFKIADYKKFLYDTLADLEIIGELGSSKYEEVINQLNDLRCSEEKIASSLNIDTSKGEELIKYVLGARVNGEMDDNVETTCTMDFSDDSVRRVIGIIEANTRIDVKTLKGKIPSSIMELIKIVSPDDIEKELLQGIIIGSKMQEAVYNDQITSFLTILDDEISKENFGDTKMAMIKAKYHTYYLNPFLEKNGIERGFNMSYPMYSSSKMYADMYGMDDAAHEILKDHENLNASLTQIFQILELEKGKISEEKIRSCFLRSNLVNMSKSSREDAYYAFQEYLEDDDFNILRPDCSNSAKVIHSAFAHGKEDMENNRVISLAFKLR